MNGRPRTLSPQPRLCRDGKAIFDGDAHLAASRLCDHRRRPGLFEITQPFREELSFKPGIFQAGPVGTLADMAAACAGMTMLPRGWAASTVDYTIKLVAPASGEKLVARGRLVRSGRTLSVAASDVYAVRQGDETLCATALATIRNFEVPGS